MEEQRGYYVAQVFGPDPNGFSWYPSVPTLREWLSARTSAPPETKPGPHSNEVKARAQSAAADIIKDLAGRACLARVWSSIDPYIRGGILAVWSDIIAHAMAGGAA